MNPNRLYIDLCDDHGDVVALTKIVDGNHYQVRGVIITRKRETFLLGNRWNLRESELREYKE